MTRKLKEGWTLVEIMIVLALIGILSAVALPTFISYLQRAKQAEVGLQFNAIVKALKIHYMQEVGDGALLLPGQPATPTTGCTIKTTQTLNFTNGTAVSSAKVSHD